MSSPADTSVEPIQPTFLFAIHELNVDWTMEQNYQYGRWVPPTSTESFKESSPAALYRWSDNSITREHRYFDYNGTWWLDESTHLTNYKANSVFWCDRALGFMTARGDAGRVHVASHPHPLNNWQQLQFRGDEKPGLSRVTEFGELYLYGSRSSWIDELGLSSCDDSPERMPKATGLSGELAISIALLAFTCKAEDLDKVLIRDKAWRKGRWRGHRREHGREKQRGLVVNIYLDPDNFYGSTPESLANIEWGYNHILVS